MKNKCMHLDSNVLYSVKLKERGSYYVMICSFVPIVICNLFEFLDLALDSSNVSSNNFSNLNTVLEEHESGHSTDRVFLGDILINVRARLIKSDACCTMIVFSQPNPSIFPFFSAVFFPKRQQKNHLHHPHQRRPWRTGHQGRHQQAWRTWGRRSCRVRTIEHRNQQRSKTPVFMFIFLCHQAGGRSKSKKSKTLTSLSEAMSCLNSSRFLGSLSIAIVEIGFVLVVGKKKVWRKRMTVARCEGFLYPRLDELSPFVIGCICTLTKLLDLRTPAKDLA